MDDNFALLNEEFEYALAPLYVASPRQPFPLFDLPTELWIRICRMAVMSPERIEVTKACELKDQQEMVRQPAMTRTCRIIRQETLAFFYSSTSFRLDHNLSKCSRFWLQAIGRDNLKAMRSLEIACGHDIEFWRGCFQRADLEGKIEQDDEMFTITFS